MRTLLLAGLAGLAGCWTSSPAPARRPAPETAAGSAGGASYGGAAYGGMAVLAGRGAGVSDAIRAGFGDPCGVPAGGLAGVGTGGGTGYGRGVGLGGSGTRTGVGLGGSGTRTGLGGGTTGGSGGSGGGGGGGQVGGTATGTGTGGGDVPTVSLGAPSGPSDGLDKAIIRRYIRRNISRIQQCYEQELDHAPGLAGTVMVHFSIGGDGYVTQSSGSGLPPVDACVAAVISKIEFPKPQGGGVVVVNYPFIFQSAQDTPAP